MAKSFVKKLDSGGYEGDAKKAFKEAASAKRRTTSTGYMPTKGGQGKVYSNVPGILKMAAESKRNDRKERKAVKHNVKQENPETTSMSKEAYEKKYGIKD